ncbi:MAG: hypothetical protein Sapg2KO_37440 [Saprospiraceae bacterium]
MTRYLAILTLVCSLSTACELVNIDNIEDLGIQEGVRPIYADFDTWDEIISLPARPIENLGKIYYKAPYIFVNERFKGIHIFDNSDPSQPTPIAFIQIYGSEDIAISGNILYADNYTDLVAIDISDLNNVQVVSRTEDLYTRSGKAFPEGYSGYFECVEESQGLVVGWEEAELLNPRCLR